MARILGAVASSHTPTIGFALDTHKQNDPAWAPIFAGYKPVQEWLAHCIPSPAPRCGGGAARMGFSRQQRVSRMLSPLAPGPSPDREPSARDMAPSGPLLQRHCPGEYEQCRCGHATPSR